MSVKDGGTAFPAHDYLVGDLQHDQFQKLCETRGMSLRDWFAGQALLSDAVTQEHDRGDWSVIAAAAYALADAMLTEREAK